MAANIQEIENTVAAYLRQDVADWTVNGVNLLRKALNNARLAAERFHDWKFTYVKAQVTTGSTGVGSLASAVLESDGSTAVKLKQVETFYLKEGNLVIPLHHANIKNAATRAKEWLDKSTPGYRYRHLPDDAPIYANRVRGPRAEIFMSGDRIELIPAPTEAKVIVIDGYKWLNPYTSNTDTDFFVERGEDYLLYAGIVECNMFNKNFAENQEGNLAPPIRARDEALLSLIQHDDYQDATLPR